MTIKEVYKEALEARRELGLVGGDIAILMNTVMLTRVYNKLCKEKETIIEPVISKKKV